MNIVEEIKANIKELQEQLEDEINTASIWQDLLGTAFDRIEWAEIVAVNFEDFKEV